MIFYLDSSIINKAYAQQLSSLLKKIIDRHHKIDYANPAVWQFIENDVLIPAYLGQIDIDLIRENKEMRDVKSIDRNYFQQLTVGMFPGMISLGVLQIILENDSSVILENSLNDWCPIKIWIDYVKNDHDYKEINRRVSEAVSRKWIKPMHAGGKGDIPNRVKEAKANTYHEASAMMITAIFDSDKTSNTDTVDHNVVVKNFLTNNGYNFHEWKKREIENYIPLSVYKYAGRFNSNEMEPSTDPNIWDYIHISEHPYFKGKYQKKYMPDLSSRIDKAATKHAFSEKCYQNPVDNHMVSELQHVIFLLAKYI